MCTRSAWRSGLMLRRTDPCPGCIPLLSAPSTTLMAQRSSQTAISPGRPSALDLVYKVRDSVPLVLVHQAAL